MPSGTRYLKVYNDISSNFEDVGGYQQLAIGWYFLGADVFEEDEDAMASLRAGHADGGYKSDSFTYMVADGYDDGKPSNTLTNLPEDGVLNTAARGAAVYGATDVFESGDDESSFHRLFHCGISICGNEEVSITGNTASDTGVIFFQGYNMGISGNTSVDISGNTVGSPDGAVVHNGNQYIPHGDGFAQAEGLVMEIAHNGSVTFADNTAKYDIYNEGTLFLCADAGQSITFQHGFQNSAETTGDLATDGGTTYIGQDADGTDSTGGVYRFEDGASVVEMQTSGTMVKESGGMVLDPACTLSISNAEFEDAVFTLDCSSLTQTQVVYHGDLTVDLGFYADVNQPIPDSVSFDEGASVSFILDIGTVACDLARSLTEIQVTLEDYILGDVSALTGVDLSLIVNGVLAEDSLLVIDTEGFDLDKAALPWPGAASCTGKAAVSTTASRSPPQPPSPC